MVQKSVSRKHIDANVKLCHFVCKTATQRY